MSLKDQNFQQIPWADIVEFGQKTLLGSKLFSISWILGRFCNYNCSYCWPYARSDIPDHYDFNIYTKTIDEIKRQANDNGFNNFHFSFSGGEPTAYKNFINLVDHYSDDDRPDYQSFHMTSNCSPSLRWWKKFLPILERFNRSSITASFHSEFANETEFGDKLIFLIENGIYVTINQVMVPERFYDYYERCMRFHDRGINVTLKPQSDPTASYIIDGYTDEMLDIMQTGFPQLNNDEQIFQIELRDSKDNKYDFDQAERFNAYGFNRFKGWLCNSGYQSLVIRGNEIKRSYSCHDEILGTIENGFKLFKEKKVCITNSCVSSADSKIPKCRLI
jgi:Radical SAM superfamily/4Fe-4S single cluster domain